MVAMVTNTAVAREAAWLSAVDSLPSLLTNSGGPFQVVQAYWPGAHLDRLKTGVYVLRRRIALPRFGGQRIMPGGALLLKVTWPVTGKGAMAPLAETEQQNLDNALELLLERVNGLPADKTHGGRFLSVGETVHPPGGFPEVTYLDPEVTIAQGWLRADVTYGYDDFEIQD